MADRAERLVADMAVEDAVGMVAGTLAAIEMDCADAFPTCPRRGLICDCRLRAVRAVNVLRFPVADDPAPLGPETTA